MAFSPVKGDGRWTARQVQSDEISAQLVVLSACQTGLGQSHDAGVIGLARAFQLAGAQQVLMSLWSIEDAATVRLMKEFVLGLYDGLHAPEALRRAAVAARDQSSSPSVWAPFVIFSGPFPFRDWDKVRPPWEADST